MSVFFFFFGPPLTVAVVAVIAMIMGYTQAQAMVLPHLLVVVFSGGHASDCGACTQPRCLCKALILILVSFLAAVSCLGLL